MFVLDTDHISLFQRNDPRVAARVLATSRQLLATTVVTVEEQLRGRLDRVHRARNDAEVVKAHGNLLATSSFFRTIRVVGFDDKAQAIFRRLRGQGCRIGTQDLRIAAIVLSRNATLATRNVRDFSAVPLLDFDDWSSK